MRKHFLVWFLSLVISHCVYCQSDFGVGAYSFGNGGIRSCNIEDPFNAFNHNAWLGFTDTNYVLLDVRNHHFVQELNTINLGLHLSPKWGGISILLHQFGYQYYREFSYKVAFTKQLSETISIGSGVGSQMLYIEEKGRNQKIETDLSLAVLLSEKSSFGIKLQYSQPFQNTNEASELILNLGYRFMITPKLSLKSEVAANKNYQLLKIGMTYSYGPSQVYFGSNSELNTLQAGLSLSLKKMVISLAFGWHQELGISPNLSYAQGF